MIIIASEGSDTEKIYFDVFGSSRVQVRVIPSEGGRSAPQYIFENLYKFKSEYQIGEGDELWLAIDIDRWPAKILQQVSTDCKLGGISLAASNPCFEVWLALHFDTDLPTPTTARSLEKHLRKVLGAFQKSLYDAKELKNNVNDAMRRAESLDLNPLDRWPQGTGTRVYRLMKSILSR